MNYKHFAFAIVIFTSCTIQKSYCYDKVIPGIISEVGIQVTKPLLIATAILWLATRKWENGKPTLKTRDIVEKVSDSILLNKLNELSLFAYWSTLIGLGIASSIIAVSTLLFYAAEK